MGRRIARRNLKQPKPGPLSVVDGPRRRLVRRVIRRRRRRRIPKRRQERFPRRHRPPSQRLQLGRVIALRRRLPLAVSLPPKQRIRREAPDGDDLRPFEPPPLRPRPGRRSKGQGPRLRRRRHEDQSRRRRPELSQRRWRWLLLCLLLLWLDFGNAGFDLPLKRNGSWFSERIVYSHFSVKPNTRVCLSLWVISTSMYIYI